MYDGARLDETTRVLIEAREIMRERGLAVFVFQDHTGAVCAQGAINIARGRAYNDLTVFNDEAVKQLAESIADGTLLFTVSPWALATKNLSESTRVADFNNAQTSVEPMLELFDRAIARTI